MTRDTHNTVRNPATVPACVACATVGTPSDNGMGVIVAHNRRSKRHTDPIPDPVPAALNATGSDNATDALIGTIPADVPAVSTFAETFRLTFPNAATVPAWVDPMCGTINAAWNNAAVDADGVLRDRNTITFDGWIELLNAADPSERPARGHRYTMGSGSDIARTQNVIYVALMLCGIPWKRIPVNFGAALWRFVLGSTKCDYREHADYFVSTFGRFVAHDHNDTTGIANVDAENACRVWRDTKPVDA